MVRVSDPIVEPAPRLPTFDISDDLHRRAVGPKRVSDDRSRSAVALHRALQERQRSLAIPALRREYLKHLAFVIHRTPEDSAPGR